jgi:hypothetical protein
MTKKRGVLQRVGMAMLVCGAMQATPGSAGRPTLQECLEGSDFIRNAALSRDAGIAGDTFIERMKGDFFAIRSFPSELRWFVHDEGDESFLAEQARLVFEQPSDPEEHRAHFLRVCVDRMARD